MTVWFFSKSVWGSCVFASNNIGLRNLHSLDDSSIDYKHALKSLDRKTWTDYIILVFSSFLEMKTVSLSAYNLYAYWLSSMRLQTYCLRDFEDPENLSSIAYQLLLLICWILMKCLAFFLK